MGLLKDFMDDVIDSEPECLTCRAISSGVLLLSGLYLLQHRNNFGKINSYFQSAFGGGLVFLAFARGMNMPPFNIRDMKNERRKREKD